MNWGWFGRSRWEVEEIERDLGRLGAHLPISVQERRSQVGLSKPGRIELGVCQPVTSLRATCLSSLGKGRAGLVVGSTACLTYCAS